MVVLGGGNLRFASSRVRMLPSLEKRRLRFAKEALNVVCALFRSAALLFLVASIAAHVSRAQEPSEYQVKAAFLYNFTKFVDWPQTSGNDTQRPLEICVVGDDPFGGDLDKIVEGESVNERPLVVRRLRRAVDAKTCSIAFVSSSERGHLRPILDTLRGTSVLSVGDTPGFAQMGGVINFILQDNRVHFEINVDAAQRARLKISSKLLSLAKVVRSKDSGG
jgi:hypothetical protein